ncbi:YigZ family protein [Desulfovibrio sp. OttesenSCG-928-I05]|nr:YigZ family protein [Desulfovibrio sp. OttesenSCG-928-I05]
MAAHEEYLTPAGYGEAELVEKRSRFIGRVWAVADEAEAAARVAEMRQQHRDATHNVFAYIIRHGQTRYSDDGEPQGTSGMPTLNVFQSENITNVCCVVTRYYGGTLLGAGGLVRAYSRTAKLALDAAGVAIMRQWDLVLLTCAYSYYDKLKAIIPDYDGNMQHSDFGADITLELLLPVARTDDFIRAARDMSAGDIQAAVMDTVFRGARIR